MVKSEQTAWKIVYLTWMLNSLSWFMKASQDHCFRYVWYFILCLCIWNIDKRVTWSLLNIIFNKFTGPRSYIFFHPLRRSFARKGWNWRWSMELFSILANYDWKCSQCWHRLVKAKTWASRYGLFKFTISNALNHINVPWENLQNYFNKVDIFL